MAKKLDDGLAVPPDHDVLQHGQPVEQRHVLERAGDAQVGDQMPRRRQNRYALEPDFALARLIQAAEAIEQRGLAGAIGADQSEDLSLLDIEGYVVEGNHAAKADRHATHVQKRFRHRLNVLPAWRMDPRPGLHAAGRDNA